MTIRHSILTVCLAALLLGSATAQTPIVRNGYDLNTWYSGFAVRPTAMCVDDLGRVYVTFFNGDILLMDDTDGDGQGEVLSTFWSPPTASLATGLAWFNGDVFQSRTGVITRLTDTNGDLVADAAVDIVTGIPNGDHQNNGIVFAPNGKMYVSLGSVTNAGPEPTADTATIQQGDVNGNLQPFASGIRNAYGLAFKPGFGLVATDNAWNEVMSDPNPVDELLFVSQSKDYGFPNNTGYQPVGMGTENPIFAFPPHSAPVGLTFDLDHQWSGFENDLQVAFINGVVPAVATVSIFEYDGPESTHNGFIFPLVENLTSPIDCLFHPDGSLLIADLHDKAIHRVLPSEPTRLRITGKPSPGHEMTVTFDAGPARAGDFLVFALSGSDGPGTLLPNGKTLFMVVDDIFIYSTTPGNILNNFPIPDILDINGQATNTIWIPNYPPAVGTVLYMGGVSYDAMANLQAVPTPVPLEIVE